MNIKSTFILLTGLLLTNSLLANVFRVNNTLTTDKAQKIFKTIQEAHDATDVAAGDTLMIEGTATTYDGVDLTKRLVLIGPGYLLAQNPQTQANGSQAVVLGIDIQSEASGSILMGLTFAYNSTNYTPHIGANNVIVMRCYLPYPIEMYNEVVNAQILQNYFEGNAFTINSTNYTFTGITFRNNIIGGGVNIASTNTYQRVFSAVENNIFLGNVNLTASTFRNNIIAGKNATVTVNSGTVQNNLVSNNQLPATNGNQTYNEAQLFVGAAGNSPDGKYQLKADSPYKTAGLAGSEPGVFGGGQPYVLSGLPPIPSIYELTAESFGSKQNGLPVKIKAKANQ
ncbi:hypothetical protein AHMF7605_00040 [Adhaeribacter arboris]|uniref:Right handed beta helix domain-containing protein n=1 Tax=Adhaeribacter arboris TaxID=2072846 RepID=A0A2T2Y943_9BACT|nr:hypothetical protein [Adhaeribacter arboris]PSR52023.1 hypothetical protein AHMF7605_00040 [Adhaeribacter arboris]